MEKYVSTMVATRVRITYNRQNDNIWFAIVLITFMVATMTGDFLIQNPWLRDDLILKNKNIYYMSIVLNIVLRVTWVVTIMHFKVGPVQSRLLDFLLAALEVIRRGHWNFYRYILSYFEEMTKFFIL
ncbi:Phosphate transporter PHO1 [Glycine max]|nr:Phosphate transporter PHO1 [Glycine max]